MPVFLTPAQAAKSKLELKNPDPNDKGLYIYARIVPDSAGSPPVVAAKSEPKVKAEPKIKAEPKPEPKGKALSHTPTDDRSCSRRV